MAKRFWVSASIIALAMVGMCLAAHARSTPFLVQGIICMNPEVLTEVFKKGSDRIPLETAMSEANKDKVLCVNHTALFPLVQSYKFVKLVTFKNRQLYLYEITAQGYYNDYGQGMSVNPPVVSFFFNMTPLDAKDKAEGA